MKTLRCNTKRITLIILIAVSLILFITLLYKCVGIYYRANDDMTMQALTSGAQMGVPEGRLRFINVVYGSFIAMLFRTFPVIDWYGGSFIIVSLFCYGLIIYRVFKLTEGCKFRLIIRLSFILLIMSLFLGVTDTFQFTTVSGVISATAVFLIATYSKDENVCGIYVTYVILMILSAMIRSSVAYLAVPLSALIICYKAVVLYGVFFATTFWTKLQTIFGHATLSIFATTLGNFIMQ